MSEELKQQTTLDLTAADATSRLAAVAEAKAVLAGEGMDVDAMQVEQERTRRELAVAQATIQAYESEKNPGVAEVRALIEAEEVRHVTVLNAVLNPLLATALAGGDVSVQVAGLKGGGK